MKIAIINFSGNVGKTTIARQLLAPRMKNAQEFMVETVNASASDAETAAERLKGKQAGDLLQDLLLLDHAIVDIGASNVEDFVRWMAKLQGSHEVFDYYVVPVISTKKQQIDAVNTIETLFSLGIPAKKIRVVFNSVEVDDADNIAEQFPIVCGYYQERKRFTFRPDAVIFHNELFERLGLMKMTVAEVMADETDYRATLREAKDQQAKTQATTMIAAKWMARTAHTNLDAVFKALFP